MSVALRFKRLHPEAVLPVRKTHGSAGYDVVVMGRVHSSEPYTGKISGLSPRQLFPAVLEPGRIERLRTGWAVEIPPGYVGKLCTRSSAYADMDIDGTIDSDYRGEVLIQAVARRSVLQIESGRCIAQLLIIPCLQAASVWADELSETARGAGGFGSTGRS